MDLFKIINVILLNNQSIYIISYWYYWYLKFIFDNLFLVFQSSGVISSFIKLRLRRQRWWWWPCSIRKKIRLENEFCCKNGNRIKRKWNDKGDSKTKKMKWNETRWMGWMDERSWCMQTVSNGGCVGVGVFQ